MKVKKFFWWILGAVGALILAYVFFGRKKQSSTTTNSSNRRLSSQETPTNTLGDYLTDHMSEYERIANDLDAKHDQVKDFRDKAKGIIDEVQTTIAERRKRRRSR